MAIKEEYADHASVQILAKWTCLIVSFGFLFVFIFGVLRYGIIPTTYLSSDQLLDAVFWVTAITFLSLVSRLFARPFAHYVLTAVIALYFTYGLGTHVVLAALLLFSSCWTLGQVVRLRVFYDYNPTDTEIVLLGMAIMLCLFNAIIHLKLNYRVIYYALTIGPICIYVMMAARKHKRPLTVARIVSGRSYLISPLPIGNYIGYSLFCILVGYVARYAFYPSVGFDDNALHLRLWSTLSEHHVYDFDYLTQVLSLEPMNTDLLHAITSILAGTDARGALNVGLLLLLLRLMWHVSGFLRAEYNDRLLIIGLYASTPLLLMLVTTLQAELFLSVLAVASMLILVHPTGQNERSDLLMVVALTAMLCGTKVPAILMGAVLVLLWAVKHRVWVIRSLRAATTGEFIGAMLFFTICAGLAFQSYLYSWYVTGNPIFPFYNGIFRSKYFYDYNFIDTRYLLGMTWHTYLDVFFNTSKYVEGQNLIAGFQYMIIVPTGVLFAALTRDTHKVVFSALPALVFLAFMFGMIQYIRYPLPGLAVASVVAGALLTKAAAGRGWQANSLRIVMICALLLNCAYSTGSAWYFLWDNKFSSKQTGNQTIADQVLPEQKMNRALELLKADPVVFYDVARPFGATLRGRPIYSNWNYSPKWHEAFSAVTSSETFGEFLKQAKIDFVMWDLSKPYDATQMSQASELAFLSDFGIPRLMIGSVQAYGLSAVPVLYSPVFSVSDFRQPGSARLPRNPTIDGKTGALLAPLPSANLLTVDLKGATYIRYSATVHCPTNKGMWIAQVNWDNGQAYYRLVACNKPDVNFSESISVPEDAYSATVYAGRRSEDPVWVSHLEVGGAITH